MPNTNILSPQNANIPLINISPVALTYLRNQLSNLNVVIHLKPTGCAGYEFTLSEVHVGSNISDEYSMRVTSHDINFFFKPSSLSYLDGITIDLDELSASKKITFKSPLETARCGCGKSISF